MKKLLNSNGLLIHLKRIETCESPADVRSDDSVECKPKSKRASGDRNKGKTKTKRGTTPVGSPRSTSSRTPSHCTPPHSVGGCATPRDSESSDNSDNPETADSTKSALIDEARVLCKRLQELVDSLEKV